LARLGCEGLRDWEAFFRGVGINITYDMR
jgi:hypothetical protein